MGALVWPDGDRTIPPVSSEYGMRFHPIDKVWRLHGGIDLVRFSTICSPVDGVIIAAGYSGGWGNLVKVREHDTRDEFWLAHNARFLTSYGAHVSAGQSVAIMGTTGASTGVHSHFEVRPRGGAPVNPRDYYTARYASSAGGGGNPFPTPTPPKDDEMSAAELADLKAHVTAEANRTIIETANRVMTFVIPSWVPGASNPSLGKLIRALFSDSFTLEQQRSLATGYEPGVRLERFARSDGTGSVFALYEGEDGVRYRFKVTDPAQLAAIGADVLVVPQAELWAYGPETGKGHAIDTDFVPWHPGALEGHAKSDATGNVFTLYRNALGGKVRHLVTDPAELEALGDDVPVMAQAELWTYAPTNQ